MRLTLRSLLAYLDGLLSPQDQQDLAARVGTNAVAQTLVAQIRRVVSQPEIGAPRPDGRGLGDDANSVAEYLDNTLPSDRLETFERICIESDVHLAEVAACHAILAGVVRDPADVEDLDAAGRTRLLRAVQQKMAALAAESERKEARANAEVVRAAAHAAASEPDTIVMPRREAAAVGGATSAPPRRRPAWLAWASAAVALLLVVALGGVLAWSVTSRGRRVAVRPPVADAPMADVEPAAPAPPVAAVEAAAEERAPVAARGVDESSAIEPAEEPAVEPESAAASQPAVAIAPATPDRQAPQSPEGSAPPVAAPSPAPTPPAEQTLVPNGTALAIAAPRSPPAAPGPVVDVAAQPTDAGGPLPGAEAAPVGFVGSGGLLLHRVNEGEWAACPPESALAPRERLIAPFGFRPDINVGGVTMRMSPGTQAVVSVDPDGTPRIEVVSGRVVARASRADARLGITAGGIRGTVFAGLAAPVAATVDFSRPAGADPAAGPAVVRAELVATAGAIGWRQVPARDGSLLAGIAAEGMLEARAALVWTSAAPQRGAIERLSTEPDWLFSTAPVDAVEKRAAEALLLKAQGTQPLLLALRELATDRRAENRSLAVATLALLGEYGDLVEVLCADAPGRRLEARQWTALEAQTVPFVLARGAEEAAKLGQAFEDHGPHGKADVLRAMARGFGDDELAAGAAAALVAALDDPDLVVRRYAFKNLVDITQPAAADRLRYRPDGLPELRREGVDWWRSQLEKGLVRRAAAP